MRLFDTHCHFETADGGEILAQLRRAKAAGVEKLMAVGGSPALNESAALAAAVAAGSPAECPRVVTACGFDRDQALLRSPLPVLRPRIPAPQSVAVGEIGLDYHHSPETRDEQLGLFAAQLEEAKRAGKPVVIHTRDADDDTLALLREIPSRGIIHCFTGSPEFAGRLLDLGFYISISGIVTFKSAGNVRETALKIPDGRILVETDAPYLAPVPMRGRPNEPAFVGYVCEFLASLRGVSAGDFAEKTFENAEMALSPDGEKKA